MTRKSLSNALLVVGSIAVSILLMEAGLRFLVPDLGWDYMGRKRVNNHEFAYVVEYNAHGFRDGAFEKQRKDGEKRVFFIGDSFVYGVGTDSDHTIPHLLEQALNSKGGVKVDVFNLGVPGINTTQYLRIARSFSEYGPDVVLLGFFIDNDIWVYEMETDPIRLWTLLKAASAAIRDRVFRDCPHDWVYVYDADPTYRQLACEGRIDPWLIARAHRKQRDEQQYYRRIVKRLRTTKRIIENIASVKAVFPDTPFYVVIFPSKMQVSSEYFVDMRRLGYRFKDNKIVSDKAQSVLKKKLEARDIDYLDLLPIIQSTQRRQGRKHYHDIDSHFNAYGNQVAATAIAEVLWPHLVE